MCHVEKPKSGPILWDFLFERKKPGPLGEVRARGSAIKNKIEFIGLRGSPLLGDRKPKAWCSGPGFFTAIPMSFKLINLLIYGRACLIKHQILTATIVSKLN